jgi:hypothetical protein
MRKTLMRMAAAAAVVVATIGLAAAPANAAGPVDMPFGMAYGASTVTGEIHFTVGYSATVTGTVHAVSTIKRACASGINGNFSSNSECSDVAQPGHPNVGFSLTLTIQQRGGVQVVFVSMLDFSTGRELAAVQCTRTGCIRIT